MKRYVLANRLEFEGQQIQIKAYVSSVVVIDLYDGQWVDYILVGSKDDVLGYRAYGYSEDFFADSDYQKLFEGYETNRTEEYSAIGVEFDNSEDLEKIYQPGESIVVEGKVRNVIYKNPEQNIDWHHVALDYPAIIR